MSGDSQEAIGVALRHLARRDRTELELRRILTKKGFEEEAVRGALGRLRGWGYLDDERVALALARDRLERSGWGPMRVREELLRRGIDPSVVSRVMQQVMEGKEEESLARAAARRYSRTHPGATGERGMRRLAGYLARRGYSTEVIVRVLKG